MVVPLLKNPPRALARGIGGNPSNRLLTRLGGSHEITGIGTFSSFLGRYRQGCIRLAACRIPHIWRQWLALIAFARLNLCGELAMNRPVFIAAWMALFGMLIWTPAPTQARSAALQNTPEQSKTGTNLIGKLAPNIDLAAFNLGRVMPGEGEIGTHLVLSSLRDKNVVVLVFYPATRNDPNTAVECHGFRDLLSQFEQKGAVVIGISNRPLHQQIAFSGRERLNFPLYGDETKEACTDYGVVDKDGRVKRVTFVIDKKGIVRKAFEVKDVKTHAQEALDYVKNMK
jgi:peroxiredoxin Q/BCP